MIVSDGGQVYIGRKSVRRVPDRSSGESSFHSGRVSVMGRVLQFLAVRHMSGKLNWFSIAMAGLSFAVSSGYAADPGEQARLEQEVRDAAQQFAGFCARPEVWRYDNLRPTIQRAVAPLGTIFRPPQVPVVHLSPGSPDYRRVVGQMMYWYYLCASRKQRFTEFIAGQRAGVPPVGRALLPKSDADNESLDDETHRVESELDNARASYGRAFAWAWPYVNLRPLCHQPGFEAATILNPLVPVPKIRLSETSPDYQETVAALSVWEPKIGNASTRLKDLLDDRKAAAEAAASLNGKLLDEKSRRKTAGWPRFFRYMSRSSPR